MPRSTALLPILLVAACAQHPDTVNRVHFSPSIYSQMDCAQLQAMHRENALELSHLDAVQQKQHTNDTVSLVVGLTVFSPMLLGLLAGSNQAVPLGMAKGKHDALLHAADERACTWSQYVEPISELPAWKANHGDFPPL